MVDLLNVFDFYMVCALVIIPTLKNAVSVRIGKELSSVVRTLYPLEG